MSLIVKVGKKGKQFLKKYILPPAKHSISYTRRLERVQTGRRICAMTFDDGPMNMPVSPDRFEGRCLTDVLLDTLAQYGAKGTFDVIGDTSENYPDEAGKEGTAEWGGIRFDRTDGLTALSWDMPSTKSERFFRHVEFLLPEAEALVPQCKGLTEIGTDHEAIRPEDRDMVIFDCGLEQKNVRFCVRTHDPDLIAALRENEGRSYFDPANTASAPRNFIIWKSTRNRLNWNICV